MKYRKQLLFPQMMCISRLQQFSWHWCWCWSGWSWWFGEAINGF